MLFLLDEDEKSGSKQTQIHDVALEVGLELGLIEDEGAPILGIPFTLDVDGNGWRIMDMTDVTVHDITPLCLDVFVKRFELDDGLSMLIQTLSSFAKLSRVLFVVARPLRLQPINRPGVDLGAVPVFTDEDLDLVETSLESTESVDSHVLARCTGPLELVHFLSLLAENMVATNTENLGAGHAVLVATFVEEEADATLGIIHLPLRGSNRHSKNSSEMTTDMDCGVLPADNGQKGWTYRLPRDCLVPLYFNALDSILLEKFKYIL